MRLKKLAVHGFKSFADHVEIVFEDGITGVVGPNGCGKSNIADAIKWVLGEQSAKSLRGTKMEDVIFGGTEKRKRLSYCEVTLVFDNEDHALPIDFIEVAVTRRVYRSGEGEYRLNGSSCRLRDIVDLFRDTGIGRDGYSMIGQGRIDEILSVKSEDRRQVFEEAAGIVKFKTRKQDAQRRMDNTLENLSRVEDILTELEGRVEPLRQQSEAAREYLSLRDELKGLDVNVFLLRTERYEARIKELNELEEELKQAVADAEAKLEAAAAKRDEYQDALGRLETRTAEERNAVQELIREVEAREGAVGVLRERMASLEKEKARLEAQRDAAAEGSSGITGRIEALTSALERDRAAFEKDSAALEADEKKLTEDEETLRKLEDEAEEKKQQIIKSANRLGDVRSRRARFGAVATQLRERLDSMESDDARESLAAQSLSEQVAEAREKLDDERERFGELGRQGRELDTRVTAFNDRFRALGERINACRSERQTVDSRLKLLKEMQRDYEGYNNSVKQVLMRARQLPDSGVHGVVADLIRVPARYERAVDMVLGGALQNVVVDRDEDAKRMIDYLRANRYGRATFLPIGSVRGRTLTPQERQVLKMPGCLGVASELIGFDPAYQGVVDNLLGRTVIAEDLNSGIAIQRASHYQLRLVTVEGDVMHSGGSMTGGSVQSRITSLLSRSREIEENEAAIRRIDGELADLRRVYDQMDAERKQLKAEQAELIENRHAQEILVARGEEALKAALDEQAGYEARAGYALEERKRLEAQLQDVQEGLKELDSAEQSEAATGENRREEVKKLQDEIFRRRGEVEALRERVGDMRVRLAEAGRDIEARASERDGLVSRAEESGALYEDSVRQLAENAAAIEENASSLEEEIKLCEDFKARLDLARERFNVSDAERIAAQEALRATVAEVDEIRKGLDDTGERLHRCEMQLQRVESEYKQIRDRIWEDYELTYATAEPLRQAGFKLGESEKRIAAIRARIREMGSVNVAAVDEYRQVVERVKELSSQRDDLLKAQADLEQIIADLEERMEKQFRTEFAKINENFARTFTALFGGGTAELRLDDPKDALNCGIEIVAQPPGKKLQMLSLLSGGERALTAIAILFAILDLKPTPFCVLDEIEAALDDANIDTYADYLKSYAKKTQFIVITHRKGTMERCDALYGVVMQEKGVSRTVSVKLNDAITGE